MKVLTKILTRDDIDVETLISYIKAGYRINVVIEDVAQPFSEPEWVYRVFVYERVRDDDNTEWTMSSWWENPDYEGDETHKARANEYLASTGNYPKVSVVTKTVSEVINAIAYDWFGCYDGRISILVDAI